MSGLSQKAAIVTGASKGIGCGIATALAAAGARVAVNYSSDRQGAERVAHAIGDSGGEVIAVGADASGSADVARLCKEVDSPFGRLDILVDNAGIFHFGAFTDITEESFRKDYLAPRRIRSTQSRRVTRKPKAISPRGTFEGGAGAALAEKTPLGRVTDIAPLAVFLPSDESAWITGEVIRAAGGLVVAT